MATENVMSNLRVAYSNLPPYVIVKNFNGSSILNGFMPYILLAVAKWMNITLTFIREPDDRFGTCINDTWDGMVGMLYRNEVDLILNPLIPKPRMLEFAYFTNPVTVDAYTFLSGKKTLEPGLFLYFNVLDKTVWIAMLIAALTIAVCSTIIHRKVITPHQLSSISMTRQYCWMLISYMLRQNPGERFLLRTSKARLSLFLSLFAALWIIGIGFLVMNTFQSLLVSKLTVKKSQPLVDSLADLVKSNSPVGIVPVEIQIEDVLQNSGIPVYDAAWQKIKHNLMPGKQVFVHEMIEEVQGGKFCILHGHIILKNRLKDFYQKTSYCNMHLSKNSFFPFPLVLSMQKSVPISFYEEFNVVLTRLIDADIPGKSFRLAEEISNLCINYSEKKLNPISIKNIYGVLVVWSVGLLSGGAILVCEITCQKLKEKKEYHKKMY